jgi:hypothetical protein
LLSSAVTQSALDVEDAVQRLVFLSQLLVLPEDGITILKKEFIALE